MKKRFVAILLALFAGFVGAHKFYLRQPEMGIGYIALFVWLGRFLGFPITSFLGWYDAYRLMTMDPIEFDRKYNSRYFRDRYGRRLDHGKWKKRKGGYLTMEDERTTVGKERENYLKPTNRYKELESYRKAGIRYFKDFELKSAIEQFKKALEIEPDDKALHFNIACAYSMEEKAIESFIHLDKAVQFGFKDFNKILTHESLAFIRVLPQFELFKKNAFRIQESWLTELKNNKPITPFQLSEKRPIIQFKESL
jgi:TM2 domain-containing membrane protein YozV